MRQTLLLTAALGLVGGLAIAAPQAKRGSKKAADGAIPWITSYDEGLKIAKQAGRPVLLDFWCGT